MSKENRQWILSRRPVGDIQDGDLVFRTDPVPAPARGEVVVRNEWLSLDPANRVYMSDVKQYLPPVALGAAMRGFICGTVVASATDVLAVGTTVMGLGTWSDYSCVPAANLMQVPELPGLSRKDVFGQCYIVAPTAYFGLCDIGAPKIGETMVVSGAAGAVGSIAGQLGKAWGCKVVGMAGGGEKCSWIVRELGFDHAIDYKREDVDQRLRELCPEGVDIYFDNVGGDALDILMGQMNVYGRIVQCGLISTYNQELQGKPLSNYGCVVTQRLRVQGFIVTDYIARYPEALRAVATLRSQNSLKWRYHDVDGLENADRAVRLLFQGRNEGKMLIRL